MLVVEVDVVVIADVVVKDAEQEVEVMVEVELVIVGLEKVADVVVVVLA